MRGRDLGLACASLLIALGLTPLSHLAASAPETQSSSSTTFRVPPHARFISPDAALVSWETTELSRDTIEYGIGDNLDQKVQDAALQTTHRILLSGLGPRARYQYRIRTKPAEQDASVSDVFELDNALNFTVAGFPETAFPGGSDADTRKFSQAAEQILAATRVTRGYGMILDCSDGRLACELAKRSQLILFGLVKDQAQLVRARDLLTAAGIYGSRVTLHKVDTLDRLPFPRSFANLIVSEASLATEDFPAPAAQIVPLLQPATGVACLGPFPASARPGLTNRVAQWLGDQKARWDVTDSHASAWVRFRRELPPNTGSWTHQYADGGNSANSRESLQGAAGTDRLDVQWLGRPGADFGIDRNPRMPAPLAVNGRLFHQGLNRIVGLDSYNGAILWSLEIPDLRRVNMPRDCGNWCADSDCLYVAIRNRCWVIAAGTGDLLRTFPLADSGLQASHEWGYVARAGDLLYGSSVKQGAVYTDFWGKHSWYDATSGAGTDKICSDDLFAVAAASGELKWHYHDGVLINSTLAVSDGKVLFVECRDPEVRALNTSRVGSSNLWKDQHLVALDAGTGKKLWDQPIDTADGIVVFYLLAAESKVFLMASAAGKYHLYAFSAVDGKSLWASGHDWTKDNHGGHLQHPVVVRNRLFLEPCGYDIETGNIVTRDVGRHGGCATYAATLNALIYRGDSGRISMWDMDRAVATSWYNLRPSCWLSTVPANGMVLSPEGGGGCSCGNWLETSIGFAPIMNAAR